MIGILVLSFGLGLAMDVVREPVVRIDTGGAFVMHRTPVIYPDAAINRGVEGVVVVEATLDESGNVIDARVLSGPAEFRKAALGSVLDWHFRPDAGQSTRQVNIAFRLTVVDTRPMERAAPVQPGQAHEMENRRLKAIQVLGLPEQLRDELLSRLPVRAGEVLSDYEMRHIGVEVRKLDEHLGLYMVPLEDGQTTLLIAAPDSEAEVRRRVEEMIRK